MCVIKEEYVRIKFECGVCVNYSVTHKIRDCKDDLKLIKHDDLKSSAMNVVLNMANVVLNMANVVLNMANVVLNMAYSMIWQRTKQVDCCSEL